MKGSSLLAVKAHSGFHKAWIRIFHYSEPDVRFIFSPPALSSSFRCLGKKAPDPFVSLLSQIVVPILICFTCARCGAEPLPPATITSLSADARTVTDMAAMPLTDIAGGSAVSGVDNLPGNQWLVGEFEPDLSSGQSFMPDEDKPIANWRNLPDNGITAYRIVSGTIRAVAIGNHEESQPITLSYRWSTEGRAYPRFGFMAPKLDMYAMYPYLFYRFTDQPFVAGGTAVFLFYRPRLSPHDTRAFQPDFIVPDQSSSQIVEAAIFISKHRTNFSSQNVPSRISDLWKLVDNTNQFVAAEAARLIINDGTFDQQLIQRHLVGNRFWKEAELTFLLLSGQENRLTPLKNGLVSAIKSTRTCNELKGLTLGILSADVGDHFIGWPANRPPSPARRLRVELLQEVFARHNQLRDNTPTSKYIDSIMELENVR